MAKGDPLSASGFPHSREHHEGQNTKNNQASCRILGESCDQCSNRVLPGHRQHGSEGFGIRRARRSLAADHAVLESQRFFGKIIWLLPLIALAMAGCSFDGSYRYECQDPKIFSDREAHPECHKPLCEASGICSEDILGAEIYKRIMDQVDGQKG